MSTLPVVFVPFSESTQPFNGSQIPIEVKEEQDSSAEDEAAVAAEADTNPQQYAAHGEQSERKRSEGETSAAHEIMDFNDEMIRVLLDLYKSHCNKMSNSRNNSEKAMWWEKMASEFNAEFNTSFSKKRLRTKVNNLKNKLRRFEDQHRMSGHGQTKIKMHKDLLDAFGNISGVCVEAPNRHCAATDGEELSSDRDGECVQRGVPRKLHGNPSKVDTAAVGEVSEDFAVASSRAQQERENESKRRLKELEEKERTKRRRIELEEEDAGRRVAGEEARKQEQQKTKESDEERRHREIMSVAQGILTALNKIVDKL